MTKKTREEMGVKAGDKIIIKGIVTFSEVATRVEGQRLDDKIKREEGRGAKFPVTVPHYAIAIEDVEVGDEYKGTPLANYHGQEVYLNKAGKSAMGMVTKSPFKPNVYHIQADGKALQLELEAELGKGQPVELLVEAFGSKTYAKLGSSFSALKLPQGNIKMYSSSANSEIEAFGLEMVDVAPVQSPYGGAAVATVEAPSSFVESPVATKVGNPSADPFVNTQATAGGITDNPFG